MKGYRPSSYIIDVPLEDDRCMLVHGYTGAVDIVSDNVSVFLKHTGTPTKGKSCISKSAFEILVRRGYLTNKNETEEVLYVQKMADLLHRRSKLIYCNLVLLSMLLIRLKKVRSVHLHVLLLHILIIFMGEIFLGAVLKSENFVLICGIRYIGHLCVRRPLPI